MNREFITDTGSAIIVGAFCLLALPFVWLMRAPERRPASVWRYDRKSESWAYGPFSERDVSIRQG
ncbi:MAG: hypothetical protein QM667_07410 [Asticcacaulis sp.]